MQNIALFLFGLLALAQAAISPPPDFLGKRNLTMPFTASLSSYLEQAALKKQKVAEPVPRKGMTWQVKEWPIESNNWAANVGCTQCNAQNGDTLCSEKLPLLCVIDYQKLARPYYEFARDSTNAMADGGFYNGWTGGYFAATEPVEGKALASKQAADKLCIQKFGKAAQAAEHHMGKYMPYMSNLPNVKQSWDWNKAVNGGWTGWGYIKGSLPCGKMWAWVNDQPNANCGA